MINKINSMFNFIFNILRMIFKNGWRENALVILSVFNALMLNNIGLYLKIPKLINALSEIDRPRSGLIYTPSGEMHWMQFIIDLHSNFYGSIDLFVSDLSKNSLISGYDYLVHYLNNGFKLNTIFHVEFLSSYFLNFKNLNGYSSIIKSNNISHNLAGSLFKIFKTDIKAGKETLRSLGINESTLISSDGYGFKFWMTNEEFSKNDNVNKLMISFAALIIHMEAEYSVEFGGILQLLDLDKVNLNEIFYDNEKITLNGHDLFKDLGNRNFIPNPPHTMSSIQIWHYLKRGVLFASSADNMKRIHSQIKSANCAGEARGVLNDIRLSMNKLS